MKIHWDHLTDEIIRRADFIEAVDPATRRAFRIWHRESAEQSFSGARIETLVVYMPSCDFGELKSRVRAVKGCQPAVVEYLSLSHSDSDVPVPQDLPPDPCNGLSEFIANLA